LGGGGGRAGSGDRAESSGTHPATGGDASEPLTEDDIPF